MTWCWWGNGNESNHNINKLKIVKMTFSEFRQLGIIVPVFPVCDIDSLFICALCWIKGVLDYQGSFAYVCTYVRMYVCVCE